MSPQMILKHGNSHLPHVLASHEIESGVVTVRLSSFDSVLLANYAAILDAQGFRVHSFDGNSESKPATYRLIVEFAGVRHECEIIRRMSSPPIITLNSEKK